MGLVLIAVGPVDCRAHRRVQRDSEGLRLGARGRIFRGDLYVTEAITVLLNRAFLQASDKEVGDRRSGFPYDGKGMRHSDSSPLWRWERRPQAKATAFRQLKNEYGIVGADEVTLWKMRGVYHVSALHNDEGEEDRAQPRRRYSRMKGD